MGAGGVVFVAGAADSQTHEPSVDARLRVPCLWAISPQGEVLEAVCGEVTDDWQAAPPDMRVLVTEWGSAYAIDSNGGLYGRLVNGRSFHHSLGRSVLLNPVIGPGSTVYVGVDDGVLGLAVEDARSPVRSAFTNGSPARWLAIEKDRTLYVGSTHGGTLYALAAQGQQKWALRGQAGLMAADPRGGVFVARRNTLRAYNAGGVLTWSFEAAAEIAGLVFDATGRRVYATEGANVHALDHLGRKAWTFALDANASSSPVVGPRGDVFVMTRRGRIYGLGPGGTAILERKVSPGDRQGLTVSADRLYVHSSDGHLYAFSREVG